MSAPAEPGRTEAKNMDRRISLGKYVKRISSVFKREKSTRTAPLAAPAAPSANERKEPLQEEAAPTATSTREQPQPEPEPEPEHKPATVPTITATTTTAPTATAAAAAATTTPAVVTIQLDRHAWQQERARALFAKYGLTLDTHEWIAAPTPIPTIQRVEKSIRMRLHRSCHHCGTVYGPNRVCSQCDHKRCKKCPRYPKRRLPADKENEKPADEKPKKNRILTITTIGGTELAYQPSKQRARRFCHKCNTLFVPSTATVCEQCRHIPCYKCPREPSRLQKWPDGYAAHADVDSEAEVEKQLDKFRRTWRKPRQRVRWECEQCNAAFITGTPQCPGCGHERCEKCTRLPIKKTAKEDKFDPDLVAAVEAKLRALDVDSDVPPTPAPDPA